MLDQRLIVEPFHLERSHLLDAFVALEQQIVAILSLTGAACAKDALLGHKVERLKTIKACPRFSKARKAAVLALIPAIEELVGLRGALVHAQLKVVRIDGTHKACLINARDANAEIQSALLLDLSALSGLVIRTRSLSEQLRRTGEITPASSPRRPSPGAGGDP